MHPVSNSARPIPLYPLFSQTRSNSLPPEIGLEIEKYLDKSALLNALRSLIIPTRDGKLINSPALKLHLLPRNVPLEYQYDLVSSDDDLWEFALNQLVLIKDDQLDQVVKKPTLFKLLQLVDCPVLFSALQERIEKDFEFEKKLFDLIELSKTEEVQVIAANTLWFLIKMGINMSGRDFRGIRVPKADLSDGVFNSTQLQKADLRGAKLCVASLHQANLSEAQMDGVQFGELPYLQHESAVLCCTYSADGKNCVVGLLGGKIHIYDTSTWVKIRTLEIDQRMVKSVAYSPNGEQIASGHLDQTVRLWGTQNGELSDTLSGYEGIVVSVVYAPNGKQIASSSLNHTVWLRDALSGVTLHILKGHSRGVVSAAYSPDSAWIATASLDKTVMVWDALSGKRRHILQGHEGGVFSVACSPDGTQIVSCGNDKTVRTWDTRTGQLLQIFRGHEHTVCSVAYSPNGELIASGGDDKTVRLWNTRTGKLLQIFRGHQQTVGSVTFSPNGRWITSGSLDKTVRLWEATKESEHDKEVRPSLHSELGALNVKGMLIGGVSGLSEMNARLLKQRGAVGEPVSVSEVKKRSSARISKRLSSLLDICGIRC